MGEDQTSGTDQGKQLVEIIDVSLFVGVEVAKYLIQFDIPV